MNKGRREEVNKAIGLLEEAVAILDTIAGDEREYYDNMPENMQSGDKGMTADEAASSLETARDSTQEALTELGNIP